MKSLLKIFITVLFSVFLETYSMEKQPQENIEIDFSNLPKDLWGEIVKYGVNKNAQTEKEIFQMMDSLRATSKTTKEVVDNLVKNRSFKKNKTNYSYVDLKNDIMQDILIERAKVNVPLRADDSLVMPSVNKIKQYKAEILNQAVSSGAINWSKYRLNIDPEFQERLDQKLLDTTDEKNFETLLKMGANPNYKRGTLPALIFISIQPNRSPHIVELLLKYGANPNARSESALPENNILSWMYPYIHRIKDPVENVRILLKYGLKINSNDLYKAQFAYPGLIGYKFEPNDNENTRKLKKIMGDIVTLIEEHLKNIETKKSIKTII